MSKVNNYKVLLQTSNNNYCISVFILSILFYEFTSLLVYLCGVCIVVFIGAMDDAQAL